jgi:hypothetical protein
MLRYFVGAVHNGCALRLPVRRWLVALPSHQPQVLPAIIANLGSGTVASGRAGRIGVGLVLLRKGIFGMTDRTLRVS